MNSPQNPPPVNIYTHNRNFGRLMKSMLFFVYYRKHYLVSGLVSLQVGVVEGIVDPLLTGLHWLGQGTYGSGFGFRV